MGWTPSAARCPGAYLLRYFGDDVELTVAEVTRQRLLVAGAELFADR